MRHKLGVVVLAALMTVAGAREAQRQFGELKSSVAEWTSASILGNVLVFAGGAPENPAAPSQTILIADARTHSNCKGEHSPAAAVLTSRPASQQKAAGAEHARTEKSPSETTSDVRGLDALAHSLAAAREQKSREQLIVRFAPQVSQIAEAWGEQLNEQVAAQTAIRARQTGEAEAARARVASELKKLGLRKVFVRVATTEVGARAGGASKPISPAAPTGALELRTPAGFRGVALDESAPSAAPLPVDQQDLNCFFKTPGPRA
ncbi:MAG: hypothetical protein M3268_09730 [Acidobacteriota bacterium]|nr:hypothetical protein [Acidobacteriota bacterium]